MAVEYFLVLLFRLFRWFVNAFNPLRLLDMPPSSVDEILSSKSVSLPTVAYSRDWRQRMQHVLNFLSKENPKRMTPFGRWLSYQTLRSQIDALKSFESIPRKFPQVMLSPINRPVFILGLPRSGTTILHRLLSSYPNAAAVSGSLSQLGGIRPDDVCKASSIDDLRKRIAVASKRFGFLQQLLFDSGCHVSYSHHPVGVFEPEECQTVLNKYLFYTNFPFNRGRDFIDVVVGYRELVHRAYEFFKRDLQVIQSVFDDVDQSRFVLKAPYHTPFTDIILHHFPDAFFVRLHRNPVESASSMASLIRATQAPFWEVDCEEIGRECGEVIRCLTRALVNQTLPAGRSLDVRFDEVVRDPVAVCQRIACQIGFENTESTTRKLTSYLREDANNRTKAGPHKYTVEEFSLNAEDVLRDCNAYCRKFGV
ncbi:omega-hydroxy-beta-dihydromenaquinone-9 sulfotransferase Stf3-like [Oscarella lobularis]|uniref:omega-hydroxy-beta-dihydromenaquinone-9 sulfotransferase Stf3-like n=1 Tax=Oscarella lobularis TaxID=121494 RepID=UPI003313595C